MVSSYHIVIIFYHGVISDHIQSYHTTVGLGYIIIIGLYHNLHIITMPVRPASSAALSSTTTPQVSTYTYTHTLINTPSHQHTLPCQYPHLTHLANTPCKYSLSIYPLTTSCQHTLLIHPTNTPYQHLFYPITDTFSLLLSLTVYLTIFTILAPPICLFWLLSVSFWNFLAVGNYAGRFYKFAMSDVAGWLAH